MLRKFRRNSKEPTQDGSCKAGEDTATATLADGTPEESQPRCLTFFDLPAEIRNAIYENLISETTLSLSSNIFAPSKRSRLPLKRRKCPLTPNNRLNGLLLASRQCRQEYLSFLLSTVRVVAEAQDFDFENLIRVSSSLKHDDFEYQALQSNRHLTVLLITRNCSSKDLASLRRWLDYRACCKVDLPWKYEFPLERLLPPTTMGRVRLLRELEYYADMLSMMEVDLEPGQRSELRLIVEAFKIKVDKLENDLEWLGQRSKRSPSNLRGLPGGGVL